MNLYKDPRTGLQSAAGGGAGKKLLDLGCGPGLYAELFDDRGFQVTGLDFSRRSVQYAREHAAGTKRDIRYEYKNYLDMDGGECI